MTLAAYTGHEPLTFPDYLDQGTGRTLTAEPGETYDIAPASGRLVADIPAGWFTSVSGEGAEAAEVSSETGEPAETGGEEAGGEPDEDDHSAF